MPQASSIQPSMSSDSSESLHPSLKAALANLDVQLEEELARYRRQRAGRTTTPPRSFGRKQARKPLELIAVGATGGRTNPSPSVPEATNPADATPTSAASNSNPSDRLPFTGIPLPEASSALALVTADGEATQSDPFVAHLATHQPDDYLESSEELLRSLSEEVEAEEELLEEPDDRSMLESLLTPMGLGSMLMLLVASAMFGYVIMNPSSLTGLARLIPGRNDNATPATGTPTNPTASNPNSHFPPLDGRPADLNPNRLTALPTAPAAPAAGLNLPAKPGTPNQAVPVPQTPTVNSSARSATVSPGSSGGTEKSSSSASAAPSAAEPAPQAPVIHSAPARSAAIAPAPAVTVPTRSTTVPANPEPPAAESYNYKVVTPFSGDGSLDEARKVVPDAFLNNNFSDGAKIQLGASSSRSEAEAKVQDLRRRGITAEVQKLDK